MGTLERLLAPLEVTEFTERYFGRQRLHLSGTGGGFPDVLDLDGFEELLLTLTNPADDRWLKLVRRGTALPVVSHLLDARGMILAPVVLERFAKGYSIVLGHVHRRSLPLRRICQELERELAQAAGVQIAYEAFGNAYLSPPGNQAFNPHNDAEDVFVLQLSGSKRWAIWEHRGPGPVRSQQGLRLDPDHPDEEIVLRSGDLLYLPGGMPHAARTLPDEHSLHLTIGIQPVSRGDVLLAAVNGSDRLGERMTGATGDLEIEIEGARAARIAADLHRRALSGAAAEAGPLGRLVRPLAAGDRVALVAGAQREVLDERGGGVTVVGRGYRRSFDGEDAGAVRRLLAGDELTVGESIEPGVATALIACGLAAPTPAGDRVPA